jgi:molybdenum cofactor biosynthesis enzyme
MARNPSSNDPALTHIDQKGEARMVDVSAKASTFLVGESLMRQTDVTAATRALLARDGASHSGLR